MAAARAQAKAGMARGPGSSPVCVCKWLPFPGGKWRPKHSHLEQAWSHKGPAALQPLRGQGQWLRQSLGGPIGPCWLYAGGLGEAMEEMSANRSAHWELPPSLTHGWRVGFHNTAPPPRLKLSFSREAGQGQVTPSSLQPPADPHSHLLSPVTKLCGPPVLEPTRPSHPLPVPCGRPASLLHTHSLLQRRRGALLGRPSPLGLVSNPTAQLSLHTRVCQRRGCPRQPLSVSLQSLKQLFWTLHQPAWNTFTHTHTHFLR